MSLKRELENPASALRRVLDALLPDLGRHAGTAWKAQMNGKVAVFNPDLPADVLGHAISEQAVESVIPLDVREGLVSGVSALAFVVSGSMIAPRFRLVVALALYSIGAWIAWLFMSPWEFPEFHPRGYQPSWVPLPLTLLGGLIGLLVVLLQRRRSTCQQHSASAG